MWVQCCVLEVVAMLPGMWPSLTITDTYRDRSPPPALPGHVLLRM